MRPLSCLRASLVVTFFVFSALAETRSHESFTEQAGARDRAKTPLGDRELKLIAEWFNAPDSLIKEKFADRLAAGTELAKNEKNEDEVALPIAQLVGSLPDEARDRLGEKLVAEIKGLERTDSDYAARLKRFLWGKELLRPSADRAKLPFPMRGEEFERFKAAFLKAAPLIDQQNRENVEKLAKGEIPPEVKAALPGWIENQARFGNAAAADRTLRGLAGDRKAFDMTGKEKLNRVHFAEGNHGAAIAFRQFLDQNKSSARNFTLPERQGMANPDVEFRPRADSTPKKAPEPKEKQKEPEKKEPEKKEPEKKEPEEKKKTDPPKQPDASAFNVQAIYQTLKNACARCHVGDDAEGGPLMNANGEPMDQAKIQRIWVRAVQRGTMPPRGEEPRPTQAEKEQITLWARANGVNTSP